MFAVGIIMLQLCLPSLRSDLQLQRFNRELRRFNYDLMRWKVRPRPWPLLLCLAPLKERRAFESLRAQG